MFFPATQVMCICRPQYPFSTKSYFFVQLWQKWPYAMITDTYTQEYINMTFVHSTCVFAGIELGAKKKLGRRQAGRLPSVSFQSSQRKENQDREVAWSRSGITREGPGGKNECKLKEQKLASREQRTKGVRQEKDQAEKAVLPQERMWLLNGTEGGSEGLEPFQWCLLKSFNSVK